VTVKRDIRVEAQRELGAPPDAVLENPARRVSEDLHEILKPVNAGERVHASVRSG
jgi:hypothetical protein